ncbi:MAG: hypothetical protein HQL32_10615, partial [Planctomycetes bacterium]|nr:hypothetical protein [Planctomycetota bacterium]
SLASCRQELELSKALKQEVEKQKTEYKELNTHLTELNDSIIEDKRELGRMQCLEELADGNLSSLSNRLRRDLTSSFKELLPKITSERYGSIKISEEYRIQVFSEERGDFVPLEHLSSGTNDLFVLILQIMLVHGFLESRNIEQHFLFLDEPLLAVDAQRYQKLTSLLPEISAKLEQIFICRPPEKHDSAYVVQTDLAQKELIINFSS